MDVVLGACRADELPRFVATWFAAFAEVPRTATSRGSKGVPGVRQQVWAGSQLTPSPLSVSHTPAPLFQSSVSQTRLLGSAVE